MYQSSVESRCGEYPVTLSFLELVATFLGQHYVGGPLAGFVMYCLHDVLGTHHQWRYR